MIIRIKNAVKKLQKSIKETPTKDLISNFKFAYKLAEDLGVVDFIKEMFS